MAAVLHLHPMLRSARLPEGSDTTKTGALSSLRRPRSAIHRRVACGLRCHAPCDESFPRGPVIAEDRSALVHVRPEAVDVKGISSHRGYKGAGLHVDAVGSNEGTLRSARYGGPSCLTAVLQIFSGSLMPIASISMIFWATISARGSLRSTRCSLRKAQVYARFSLSTSSGPRLLSLSNRPPAR
jgi:hypothetical protein